MKTKKLFSVLAILVLLLAALPVLSVGAAGPTVTPGYSGLTEAAGVRYRGNSSGNEIYLGIPDLGVGGNRVEKSYPNVYANWQDGTYDVTFSFDQVENKITTTIDGPGGSESLEYDFDDRLAPGCSTEDWNIMDINIVDRLTTGELAFNNVMLDGYSLGNFDDEGWKNWTVTGFDFSQSFTLSGDLVVQGWTGSETNKMQIVVGCYTPPNQPPVADANGPYLVAVEQSVALDGSGSSDPDDDPLTESWVETGVSSLGTIVGSTFTVGTVAGITEVTLTVDDGKGGIATDTAMLVVYDPSGGFVTGGGWIDSPAGAMEPTPMLVWSQDFSLDDSGWFDDDDGWYGDIAVSSGTATFYGDSDSAPFSRFDGYRDVWPGTWTAEIDVYLDPSWPSGQGFDYSVAASGSDGNHQRDYIFHVGVVENYGPITGKALLVNGSNNADFSTNPYKLVNDNGGNYYTVDTAGWYTLQHVFYDAGGYLAVDLNLLDANGAILWTATRENVADTIPGEVGGNRYAWFTHIDVADGIQVDNHQLFIPVSPTGKATFGFVSKYKKGADVPTGNTEFQFKAGNLNFHSTSYDWLVVTGSDFAKFKGSGTINGQGDYKFQIWAGDNDPDTFRIKIWDAETEAVIYDNGMDQAIGGGSIVVHKAK